MEKAILSIITKALKQTKSSRIVYSESQRAIYYVGVRVRMQGCPPGAVALELSYSPSAISKMLRKWDKAVAEGDEAVLAIVKAYNSRHYVAARDNATTEEKKKVAIQKMNIPRRNSRPAESNALGFHFTARDEADMQEAIRSSILFMHGYGQGRIPRNSGMYYAPDEVKYADKEVWLPAGAAALYCGCSQAVIGDAGQEGVIERRPYARTSTGVYYEYKLESLESFLTTINDPIQ